MRDQQTSELAETLNAHSQQRLVSGQDQRLSCEDIEVNGRPMRHKWREYKWGILCLNCGLKIRDK